MKVSGTVLILTGIIIILAAALIGTLVFVSSKPEMERGIAPVEITPMEPDSSKWGVNFPSLEAA